MRELVITVIQAEEVGGEMALPMEDISEGWVAWLAEVANGRVITQFVTCEFGVAEEVIGWASFGDNRHRIVLQEALRPERHIYAGAVARTAEFLFWEEVTKHARFMG